MGGQPVAALQAFGQRFAGQPSSQRGHVAITEDGQRLEPARFAGEIYGFDLLAQRRIEPAQQEGAFGGGCVTDKGEGSGTGHSLHKRIARISHRIRRLGEQQIAQSCVCRGRFDRFGRFAAARAWLHLPGDPLQCDEGGGGVVDELLGQQDVVIKPLGRAIRNVPGIAGATELGANRTVLLLDVGRLVDEGARELNTAVFGGEHGR